MINQAENKTDQVIDCNSDARKHENILRLRLERMAMCDA